MFCYNCGKEIDGNMNFCPECGAAQRGAISPANNSEDNHDETMPRIVVETRPYNTICIVGLVVSCISVVFFILRAYAFFGIIGIIGFFLSALGFCNCKRKNESGKALAIIGVAIGALSIPCFYLYISSLYA